MPGKEVSLLATEQWAKQIMSKLILFELTMSTTPEKQEALDKISDHRIALCEIFDVVCPGWGEGDLH